MSHESLDGVPLIHACFKAASGAIAEHLKINQNELSPVERAIKFYSQKQESQLLKEFPERNGAVHRLLKAKNLDQKQQEHLIKQSTDDFSKLIH